jgi:threonine synthase
MRYYSTNHISAHVELREAITRCIARDGGIYLPDTIMPFPAAFLNNIQEMSLTDIAFIISNTFFGNDIESSRIKHIVDDTFSFDIPLKKLDKNLYVLELFHGPTMTIKDISIRFIARVMSALSMTMGSINVILASSGNTATAIANGFSNVPGVNVTILYPHGAISHMDEILRHSTGNNIKLVEVKGTIDDCKQMVQAALSDKSTQSKLHITSVDSVNIGRLLPQTILYFHAYAQLQKAQKISPTKCDIAMPCGNLSCLTSAIIAKRMGLNFHSYIAGCSKSNTFEHILRNKTANATIAPGNKLAYAINVHTPANLPQLAELYNGDYSLMSSDIIAASINDIQTAMAMAEISELTGYEADAHTALAYAALKQQNTQNNVGIILATSHPSKTAISKGDSALTRTQAKVNSKYPSAKISPTYPALRKYLTDNL